jgi:hypothetical protein
MEGPSHSQSDIARAVSTGQFVVPDLGIVLTIHHAVDALQKLKIVPKDAAYIDLTETPPSSPRVKREDGGGSIQLDDLGNGHVAQKVKQESIIDSSLGEAGAPPSNTIPADNPHDARTSDEQFDRKRKVVEDELMEVELEQKRLRLTKALAEMKGKGK